MSSEPPTKEITDLHTSVPDGPAELGPELRAKPNLQLNSFPEDLHDAAMAAPWIRSSEFEQSCAKLISDALCAEGVDQRVVERAAQRALDSLRKEHGGRTVYIARGQADARERARRVHALKARGLTANEIAGRVSCTTQRVYQILGSTTSRRKAGAKRRKRDTGEAK